MQHTESQSKIYFTRNYDVFVNKKGNRDLNLTKIKKITQDINNGLDMLKYCPIVVKPVAGDKLEIIDGQHRFEVSKSLRSQVWYVVMQDELDLVDIARINSRVEKWKDRDFLNCYIQKGIADYITLGDFVFQYGFPIAVCCMLLKYGTLSSDNTSNIKEAFQEGTFTVHNPTEATYVADQVMHFRDFPAHRTRAFILAICKILEGNKIKLEDLVNKYQKNPDRLQPQTNWKEYLINLEAIYNINARERKTIY